MHKRVSVRQVTVFTQSHVPKAVYLSYQLIL